MASGTALSLLPLAKLKQRISYSPGPAGATISAIRPSRVSWRLEPLPKLQFPGRSVLTIKIDDCCNEDFSLLDDDNLLMEPRSSSTRSDAGKHATEFSKETLADTQTAWDQRVHSTHAKARKA